MRAIIWATLPLARLWSELDRRAAVVFIHPAKPQIPIIEDIPGPIVDYPFDTTRTAVQLVLNGVVARSPRVKIILSHAGGFVPYAAHRFAELAPAVRPNVPAGTGTHRELQVLLFRYRAVLRPCVATRACRASHGLDTSFTAVTSRMRRHP